MVERLRGGFGVVTQPARNGHRTVATLGRTDDLGVVRAVDVAPERVEFLIDRRVVCGMLNLLVGPPGVGKSTILYDFHAQVSRAGRDVVIVTGEDHLHAVVRPRLELAGADLERVHIVIDDVDLPGDVEGLARIVRDRDAALFTIDPIVAFLGSRIDTHTDASVRQALKPLSDLAADAGAAIVVVMHTNKGSSEDPLLRIGGTIGFSGAGRQVLLACADPDDESGTRRFLAVAKSNVSAFAPTLAYEIAPGVVEGRDGEIVETSRVRWLEECPTVDARSLLRVPEAAEDRGALHDAVEFLRAELADGPKASKEVAAEARTLGISERTLKRAKERLGVRARLERDSERITRWMCELPAQEGQAQGGQDPCGPLGPLAVTSANDRSGGQGGQENHAQGNGHGDPVPRATRARRRRRRGTNKTAEGGDMTEAQLTDRERRKLEGRARAFRYMQDAEDWIALRKRDPKKFDEIIDGPTRVELGLYEGRKQAAKKLGYDVGP